jgi:hypothetical protein
VACVILFAGCVQDPAGVQPIIPLPSVKGVYIVNEGNFGRGNSSLTYYDSETRQVYQDVFLSVNGRTLGDVGCSIFLRGNRLYIVVNNSHKIEIVDVSTNRSIGTINLGTGRSPRQMAFISDTIALVTCLYDASVLAVDVFAGSILQRIPVGPNPEGIAVASGKAFVANSGLGLGRTVSVVDLTSLSAVQTLTVGDNPAGVSCTSGGMVYVVCAGFYGEFSDPNDDTPARIAVIDPHSSSVTTSILIGGHAYGIAMNAEGFGYVPTTDSVVFVDTRIHSNLGKFARGQFYGLGVDVSTGDVYLSDAKNFVQPGTVYIYSASGQLRTGFDVGINPGSFAFKR